MYILLVHDHMAVSQAAMPHASFGEGVSPDDHLGLFTPRLHGQRQATHMGSMEAQLKKVQIQGAWNENCLGCCHHLFWGGELQPRVGPGELCLHSS